MNKTPYEVVQELNEELYEKTKSDSMWFTYTLSNYVDAVSFTFFGGNFNLNIDLWNSENSQQIWREETNDYEPLEDTIKRELKTALKNNELTKYLKTL